MRRSRGEARSRVAEYGARMAGGVPRARRRASATKQRETFIFTIPFSKAGVCVPKISLH